jgi:hypothetical protein
MTQDDSTHDGPATGAPAEPAPPTSPSRERRVMDDDDRGEDEPGEGG